MLIHLEYLHSPSFQLLHVGDVRAWLSLSRLGVLASSLMSTCLHAHMSSICRSSFYHLRNLSRIRKYLTKESGAIAVHAFVTLKLDYCNALLYGLPRYQLQRVQYVQTRQLEVCVKWVSLSISDLFFRSFTGYQSNTTLFSRFCF